MHGNGLSNYPEMVLFPSIALRPKFDGVLGNALRSDIGTKQAVLRWLRL